VNSKEVKQTLRRSAAYLQGNDTSYFSKPALLEAIRLLYRLAHEAHQEAEVSA
jgi:hypothetical protein